MRLPDNATLALCAACAGAAEAVEALRRAGYEMRNVSVMAGERYWDRALRLTLEGTLSRWALFRVAGLGPVLVAGPLSGWMLAASQNAEIFAGLTTAGAGLYSIGIAREKIQECEDALRAGACLVLAHGASGEVRRAQAILEGVPQPPAEALAPLSGASSGSSSAR